MAAFSLQSGCVMIEFPLIFSETNFMEATKSTKFVTLEIMCPTVMHVQLM